jgi:hypothetical protein
MTTTAPRHEATDVRPVADAMVERLRAYAERAEIGGSLRRGKADVKDIEIVILNPKSTFYEYTERLVDGGHAEKAIYNDGKTRWGKKYRGLLVKGVKVEIFVADDDNWGYQFWLRTGPGDANRHMVTALKQRCRRFYLDDGYLWVSYASMELPPSKLSVPTEADLFALFGIPYLEPSARTVAAYKNTLAASGHAWGDPTPYIIQPRDVALLDADRGYCEGTAEERIARRQAEAAYSAGAMPRTYYRMARRALEHGNAVEARRLVARASQSRTYWGERAQ